MALISMPRCEPTADIEFLCPSHPEKAVFVKIYFGIAKLFVDKMCVLHINPTIAQSIIINFCCRPPHGGRGLKFSSRPLRSNSVVALLAEGVD